MLSRYHDDIHWDGISEEGNAVVDAVSQVIEIFRVCSNYRDKEIDGSC